MSKDVAALRAVQAVTDEHWPGIAGDISDSTWLICDGCGWDSSESKIDWLTHIDAALAAAIPPNAVLIDPTAPETVAALAGALYYDDPLWSLSPRKPDSKIRAAAILPAFVSRLRGEP